MPAPGGHLGGVLGRAGRGPARRLLVRSLLRAGLTSTGLVLLYYLVPMTKVSGAAGAVWLGLGLIGFAALVAGQVGAVVCAPQPGLRAVVALAAAVPLFLLVFASAYFVLANTQPGSFTQPLTKTDSLYFTVTVFATVGFGDITPVSEGARVVTMVQMLGDIIVVGAGLRVILGAVKEGIRSRTAGFPPVPPAAR